MPRLIEMIGLRGPSTRRAPYSQNRLIRMMMGEYQRSRGQAEGIYHGTLGGYDALSGQSAQTGAGINQGYQDRLNTGMSMLQGYGDVARADIGRTWQGRAAAADQGLTSRGLGNTTVRANMQRGMAMGESQDAGRHFERLRGQQMNYYAGLSGDAMASRERQQAMSNQLGLQKLRYQGDVQFNHPSLMDIAGYTSAVQGARVAALAHMPAYRAQYASFPWGYSLRSTQDQAYSSAMSALS